MGCLRLPIRIWINILDDACRILVTTLSQDIFSNLQRQKFVSIRVKKWHFRCEYPLIIEAIFEILSYVNHYRYCLSIKNAIFFSSSGAHSDPQRAAAQVPPLPQGVCAEEQPQSPCADPPGHQALLLRPLPHDLQRQGRLQLPHPHAHRLLKPGTTHTHNGDRGMFLCVWY